MMWCSVTITHGPIQQRTCLKSLTGEKIQHTFYFPDLVLSYLQLFQILQNHLEGLVLKIHEEGETILSKFFYSKPKYFYKDGIMNLVNCWKEMIDYDGTYVYTILLLFHLKSLQCMQMEKSTRMMEAHFKESFNGLPPIFMK